MDNNTILNLLKKLSPNSNFTLSDVSDKTKLKEISIKISKDLKKTNEKLNSYIDIMRQILIKNNPDKREFIDFVNSSLDTSAQKISETYNNINELKIVLNQLTSYVKQNLRNDLNKINPSDGSVISEIVRICNLGRS